MSKFNLVTIRPSGFLHASASADVKDSLAWSLAALGHEVISSENAFARGSQVQEVIFHPELIPPGATLPSTAILYNLEQPTHPHMAQVRELAKGHVVWDYSAANVADWQSRGFDARYLPIGYTPNLTRVSKAAQQDIDVFFGGWLTPRRLQLINQLRTAGLKVYASDCCYGGARDHILSRTKVCLNVHHDGRDRFEIVRVSYLWANSKCVVTEMGSDNQDYWDGLAMGCVWNEYDQLALSVKSCVEDQAFREGQAQIGFETFSREDFTASVARVLDSAPVNTNTDPLPGSFKIRKRYCRALREGDMVDFAEWLRDHARGQVLEIGTRDGASTSALLLGLEMNDPSGHLTSIDVTDCSHLWTHPQWTFTHANSLTVRFPDSTFDLILIDGDHSDATYRGDLYNAWHWIKPGGLILSHDIKPERGHEFYAVGLREEYDKFCALHPEAKHYILPGRYGMGVIEKP